MDISWKRNRFCTMEKCLKFKDTRTSIGVLPSSRVYSSAGIHGPKPIGPRPAGSVWSGPCIPARLLPWKMYPWLSQHNESKRYYPILNDRIFWRKLDFRSYVGIGYQQSEFQKFYLNVFSSTDILKGNCDDDVFESRIKCMQGNILTYIGKSRKLFPKNGRWLRGFPGNYFQVNFMSTYP